MGYDIYCDCGRESANVGSFSALSKLAIFFVKMLGFWLIKGNHNESKLSFDEICEYMTHVQMMIKKDESNNQLSIDSVYIEEHYFEVVGIFDHFGWRGVYNFIIHRNGGTFTCGEIEELLDFLETTLASITAENMPELVEREFGRYFIHNDDDDDDEEDDDDDDDEYVSLKKRFVKSTKRHTYFYLFDMLEHSVEKSEWLTIA